MRKTSHSIVILIKESKVQFIGWLLLKIGRFLSLSSKLMPENRGRSSNIGIESGILGWETVFLQELHESLIEQTCHASNVMAVTINREKHYLSQIIPALWRSNFSSFIFDVRTGSQSKIKGVCESMAILLVCSVRHINPIAILTDGSIRLHRYQASILTARSGQIVTFLDPRLMMPLFPHNRVLGPQVMPISRKTIDKYSQRMKISQQDFLDLSFQGSLYPRRMVFFENLARYLQECGSEIKLNLVPKTSGKSIDYWEKLAAQKIVITTTFQQDDGVTVYDRQHINQLVFRVSEGLALGCLVFAMKTPGVEKCFSNGADFIQFSDFEDLGDKLIYYSENINEANRIAKQGKETYLQHVDRGFFWEKILEEDRTNIQ
jgi:hypothetical protein